MLLGMELAEVAPGAGLLACCWAGIRKHARSCAALLAAKQSSSRETQAEQIRHNCHWNCSLRVVPACRCLHHRL